MDEATKIFIRQILSVAETGKPTWNPSAVYIYNDDNRFKPPRRQITLSIGFTEGGGNLKKVIQRYIDKGGMLTQDFQPLMAHMGAKDHPSLAGSNAFIELLKAAGREQVMVEAQNEMFDELYLEPAFAWAKQYGFKEPLSYLVIADSYLHSGSMLPFLMAKFPEKKPSAGGDEKLWIEAYLKARHDWLKTHPNKVLNTTVYRANCFLEQIAKLNWDLSKNVTMHGTPVARIS